MVDSSSGIAPAGVLPPMEALERIDARQKIEICLLCYASKIVSIGAVAAEKRRFEVGSILGQNVRMWPLHRCRSDVDAALTEGCIRRMLFDAKRIILW